MYNELLINVGSNNHKAYLQNGFYSTSLVTTTMHKHNYAEIHIFDGDDAEIYVENDVYSSVDGNIIIIPRNAFHCIKCQSANILHVAFQVDIDAVAFASVKTDKHIIFEFIKEIKKSQKTNDYSSVSSYLSLFCSYLYPAKINISEITDYSFLIYEFFSKNYHKDVHLCDLASILHLSERQTQRLVIKYTGNTFSKELSEVRMNVAEHLITTTEMSLEDISRYIGYLSYAGYWKAKKKIHPKE